MDWAGVAGLVVAVITAVGVLVERLRRERRADVAADAAVEQAASALDREETEAAITQWQKYAKEREKQHNADVTRLEKRLTDHQTQLDTLAARERDCQIRAAQQEVEIRHLKGEITDLRSALQKGGTLPPDTAEHDPLPPEPHP